ncbi:MAG: low-specificity L-threonine aldolase [Deinococcaceae bacterium]
MIIDLRSDTVTQPTESMRQAMATAPVGDDVYGEDPTVHLLEQEVAQRTGFEAGLFMPSGTMANQVAIAAHTQRGQEVICAAGSHIYEWELGMMAAFSGVVPRFVPVELGIPEPEQIRAAIRRSIHQSPSGLISLENTHNKAGGTVLPLDILCSISKLAKDEGLPLHLDGARAYNAAVALGTPIHEITQHFDSVSLCLSKGLGAPVGSVLVGPKTWIQEARRYRKMMGGGMRQAGILAAAGLVALNEGPLRLSEDHRRTRQLAEALQEMGLDLDLRAVQTNILYVQVPDAAQKVKMWRDRGLWVNTLDDNSVRFVLHFQITDQMLERAIEIVKKSTEG